MPVDRRRNLDGVAFAVLAALFGMCCVFIGISSWRSQRPIAGGVLTTGYIVEYDFGGEARVPIIEFTDRREHVRRFWGKSGVGQLGNAVPVRYDPDDSTHAQWVHQPWGWTWVIWGAFGLVLLAVDAGLVLKGRRARRRGRRSLTRVFGGWVRQASESSSASSSTSITGGGRARRGSRCSGGAR